MARSNFFDYKRGKENIFLANADQKNYSLYTHLFPERVVDKFHLFLHSYLQVMMNIIDKSRLYEKYVL